MLVCLFANDGSEVGSVHIRDQRIQTVCAKQPEGMRMLDWPTWKTQGVPYTSTVRNARGTQTIVETIPPGDARYEEAFLQYLQSLRLHMVALDDAHGAVWNTTSKRVPLQQRAYGYAVTLFNWPADELAAWTI